MAQIETIEYLKMLRRMVVAAGNRVAQADEDELLMLKNICDLAYRILGESVRQQVRQGKSWSDIGRAFNISKQTAHQKWGKYSK